MPQQFLTAGQPTPAAIASVAVASVPVACLLQRKMLALASTV